MKEIMNQFNNATVTVHSREGEPMFALHEVMPVLGIVSKQRVMRGLVENKHYIYNGTFVYLTEGGLYAVAGRARSRVALAFQDWIHFELLPSFRKAVQGDQTSLNQLVKDTQQELIDAKELNEKYVRHMYRLNMRLMDVEDELETERESSDCCSRGWKSRYNTMWESKQELMEDYDKLEKKYNKLLAKKNRRKR